MDIITATLLIFALLISVSYSWGMRGTTIGGEKGAMLPGAMIGLMIAFFSKILIAQEHFYIFGALGAVSMYLGGAMTYGETLGLSMNQKPAENMKKGLAALFVKGFLWFGLFGAIFTTGINAVCNIYTLTELLIIFAITPAAAVGGYFLFNKPLNPKGNKFPKIYFSKTRQESWGALLGAFLALFIFAIIKLNLTTIIFSLSCGLFGAVGWVIGQLMQIFSIHYAADSKSTLLRKLSHKNGIDSWKIMECVLGAFGGIGAGVGFLLSYKSFELTLFNLEKNNGLLPYNRTLVVVLFIIWVVLIVADMAHYFVKRPITKKELKRQLKRKQITQEQYAVKRLKAVTAVPRGYDVYFNLTEKIEPVLYCAIPFILITLGSREAALISSFFIILFVIMQEIGLEKSITKKFDLPFKIILGVISLAVFLLQTIWGFNFGIKGTIIMYTLGYEAITLLWLVIKYVRKFKIEMKLNPQISGKKERLRMFFKANKTLVTVHGYFLICSVLTILLTL